MKLRLRTALAALAALAVVAFGGSALASRTHPQHRAHGKTGHAASPTHAGDRARRAGTPVAPQDGDSVQSGDQTAPDNAAGAPENGAEAPDGGSTGEQEGSEADGPGGHEDAPGENVDHQFEGQE